MSTMSATDRQLLFALIAAVAAAPAAAQSLYRYLDANGHWVFSDRQPADGGDFETVDLPRDADPGIVRLYERPGPGRAPVLAVENTFHGTVQIAFAILDAGNLADDVPLRGNRIVPPRSDTALIELAPATAGDAVHARFSYQYIHGDPAARHEPGEPYRLPYASASRFTVSQAYPDRITHFDQTSEYAVDFEMPVGTNVFAARGGIVLEVAEDYFEAGIDARLASRANMIRILHDDGTMGLYAHLNWNSIRVRPGQRVARGEYIADSGNTGFSSGPHLHFVVQRNIGGEIASVPVLFAGPGSGVTVVTGDEPVAY
jgi:murein DD-endopeptidase MepM/ murein hydrolase activator NlpD